jgi:thiol-disulfide isomerase/thioredoxin
MRRNVTGSIALALLVSVGAAISQTPPPAPTFVQVVGKAARDGDFATAEKLLAEYRAKLGVTPEYIEGYSWIGRGRLARNEFGPATQNTAEVRKLVAAELAKRKLDAEPHLPIALGAAIETDALALARQHELDQSVALLGDEIRRWHGTSIEMRLQKNLNLLTLEGKPVPVIDVSQGIGPRKPQPLAAHLGHPVLIFLWAHWCPDCKNEIAIVQKLIANYGAKGLVVVAPTQHYGYVAGGAETTPAEETKYIGAIWQQYYSGLGPTEIPLSEANFTKFGVSTTPTMLLVDQKGIVRLYNPGNATYEKLAGLIDEMLKGKS